jgi:uncharacterized protein (DUF2141 family)
MIRSVYFFLLFFPYLSFAQTDLLVAKSFRSRSINDTHTLFMENEGSPLPKEGELTYAITITVTDIRNKEGVIRFKFYDDATPFPHEKGFLRIVVPKSEVIGTTFTATYYGFTSKQMGIALQDDENDNWELDFGWFFPKEGHAFSDYHHTSLGRPVYSDFRFLLTGDKQVTMKMKYY